MVISEFYGYIRIMQNKMETTGIMGIIQGWVIRYILGIDRGSIGDNGLRV